MKALFMDSMMDFLKRYGTYSDDDVEKLEYGLEGIYLTMSKLIIILITAALFGIVKEFIALLILFNIIRYTGFGFHAEKSYQCLIISTFCFLFIPLFFISFPLPKSSYIVIGLVCIINYLFFAPADTIKRPLPNKKKRLIRKIVTAIWGGIYSFLSIIYVDHWICPVLISAMVIEVIVTNPLIYIIHRQPYNNYKVCNHA